MNIVNNNLKKRILLKKQNKYVDMILQTNNSDIIYESFVECNYLNDEMKNKIIKKECELGVVGTLINISEYANWITEDNKIDLFDKILELGEIKQLKYFMNVIEWLNENQKKVIKDRINSIKTLIKETCMAIA